MRMRLDGGANWENVLQGRGKPHLRLGVLMINLINGRSEYNEFIGG